MANKLIVEISDFQFRCYACGSNMRVSEQILEKKQEAIIVKCTNCSIDSTFLCKFGKINIIEVSRDY